MTLNRCAILAFLTQESLMRKLTFLTLASSLLLSIAFAQPAAGPYKILKTAKVGGAGGFDYVYADESGRKLYIPRTAREGGRVTVFDLDTLPSAAQIPNTTPRAPAVSPK